MEEKEEVKRRSDAVTEGRAESIVSEGHTSGDSNLVSSLNVDLELENNLCSQASLYIQLRKTKDKPILTRNDISLFKNKTARENLVRWKE